jgi:hypothetical protein
LYYVPETLADAGKCHEIGSATGADENQVLDSQVATRRSRKAIFAMCAADAALIPASTGAFGFFRVRTHSSQLLRCAVSPSGLS